MNEEIIKKIDEITKIISNDKELLELKKLKEDLINDKELLNKINELKQIDNYSEDYIKRKKEILSNEKYQRYVNLENKLYFEIKEINNKLNSLTEKRGCH